MCGRYQLMDEGDLKEINNILHELNEKYKNQNQACATGEIYPTNIAPILALKDSKPDLTVMSWGFPKWDNKGVVINARSESANEKKMFAKPLIERRCVVPSTGFYEWQKRDTSKAKEKYIFNDPGSPMLYMAGIYNVFKDGDGYKESFVILTRDANQYISDIHDRMPVILYKNELTTWLRDDRFIDTAFRRDTVELIREPA